MTLPRAAVIFHPAENDTPTEEREFGGWYLDGEQIGDWRYCPTDEELEAGAQQWLDGAA